MVLEMVWEMVLESGANRAAKAVEDMGGRDSLSSPIRGSCQSLERGEGGEESEKGEVGVNGNGMSEGALQWIGHVMADGATQQPKRSETPSITSSIAVCKPAVEHNKAQQHLQHQQSHPITDTPSWSAEAAPAEAPSGGGRSMGPPEAPPLSPLPGPCPDAPPSMET